MHDAVTSSDLGQVKFTHILCSYSKITLIGDFRLPPQTEGSKCPLKIKIIKISNSHTNGENNDLGCQY